MEELLNKLMTAMWEQEKHMESYYNANTIENLAKELNEKPEDAYFEKKTWLLMLLKTVLITGVMAGLKAEDIINFLALDFENDNQKTWPSKINTEYDQQLFTASCAAMTGLLANPRIKTHTLEQLSIMAINRSENLIAELNK